MEARLDEHGIKIVSRPKTRREWLAARRLGIGGSDAAAVVGMSRYSTPLKLYLIKRGEMEDDEENEAMRWGTMLEPVVRQEYCNVTGYEVKRLAGIAQHPSFQFALANLDGLVPFQRRLLECKTSQKREDWGAPGSDEIPVEHSFQVHHYMGVSSIPVCDVAVLFGVRDFRIYTVEADHELQGMLFEAEEKFWVRVQEGNPPDPINQDDVKRRWPVCRAVQVTASEQSIVAHACLEQVQAQKKAVVAEEERLKAVMQAELKDADELVAPNGVRLATWKNVKASRKFDLDGFKADHPDLWAEYLEDPRPSRRFLPKYPNAAEE